MEVKVDAVHADVRGIAENLATTIERLAHQSAPSSTALGRLEIMFEDMQNQHRLTHEAIAAGDERLARRIDEVEASLKGDIRALTAALNVTRSEHDRRLAKLEAANKT